MRCRFKRRSYSVILPKNVLQQKLPKALLSQMKIRRDSQGITNLQLMQKLGICLVLWRSQEWLRPNHGNRHTQILFWLLNMNILVTLNTDYSCFSDCISKWEFFCSFFHNSVKNPTCSLLSSVSSAMLHDGAVAVRLRELGWKMPKNIVLLRDPPLCEKDIVRHSMENSDCCRMLYASNSHQLPKGTGLPMFGPQVISTLIQHALL